VTDHQISQQGLDAHMVLENPAYKEAMAALRGQVIEQWKACPIRDREGQMLLLQLAKLADKFEGILGGMVQSGRLAQHKIELNEVRNESPARKLMRRVL
jgi:hypothetical protein